jgi:inner membrane transporter RhtA
VPAQAFFLVSAVFHYLGPSLAVLLFARVGVLGVAWLRIASARRWCSRPGGGRDG